MYRYKGAGCGTKEPGTSVCQWLQGPVVVVMARGQKRPIFGRMRVMAVTKKDRDRAMPSMFGLWRSGLVLLVLTVQQARAGKAGFSSLQYLSKVCASRLPRATRAGQCAH